MASDMIAPLQNRSVVSVSGPDAGKLLQGLITNDLDTLAANGGAIYAGLLSPQGKIQFDFFVVTVPDGYLIDIAGDKAAEFIKRLTLYKLRADVILSDVSKEYKIYAVLQTTASQLNAVAATVQFADPRAPAMGVRILANAAEAVRIDTSGVKLSSVAYDAHRVALGVPEGGQDYAFSDAYPHEANFDLLNGVSFTKGCYVGQEVVARMQNKTVVRKRVVKITGDKPLTYGDDIVLGGAVVGKVGTVDGSRALAILRLDRAIEAAEKSLRLSAGGIDVQPDQTALDTYRASVSARAPASGLL